MARVRTTAPHQPEDARTRRSIDALQSALLRLLDERPFAEISIKEITDAASLSYPTFFRRFASKDSLLEAVATAEVRKLLLLGSTSRSQVGEDEGVANMCGYISDRRTLWRTLLTGGAASAMRKEFMRVAKDISASGPRVNPWIPIDLAISFTANGIFDIFAWWLHQPDDYPTQNIVALFNALIVDNVARPRTVRLPH
jgi:AcrR family transcriptional regulator